MFDGVPTLREIGMAAALSQSLVQHAGRPARPRLHAADRRRPGWYVTTSGAPPGTAWTPWSSPTTTGRRPRCATSFTSWCTSYQPVADRLGCTDELAVALPTCLTICVSLRAPAGPRGRAAPSSTGYRRRAGPGVRGGSFRWPGGGGAWPSMTWMRELDAFLAGHEARADRFPAGSACSPRDRLPRVPDHPPGRTAIRGGGPAAGHAAQGHRPDRRHRRRGSGRAAGRAPGRPGRAADPR